MGSVKPPLFLILNYSTMAKKEVKKEVKAITSDRVTEANNSKRTADAYKEKHVDIIALKGNKHLKEGQKYNVGSELAKQLVESKKAKLA